MEDSSVQWPGNPFLLSVEKKTRGDRIVSLVLIAAMLIWGYVDAKLSMIQFDDEVQSAESTVESPVEDEEMEIPELPKPSPEKVDNEGIILPGDIYHEEDVFNILLLGTDERTDRFNENARADAIMVLSLNTRSHTIKLVSIERGIGVPVPGRNDDWITHTFRYGGAALTMQTVRDCFKVDVDRYVRVNFHVFEKIIDAIGGVDIELTQLEADGLNGKVYTNATTKHPVQAGWNHLDGYDALQYSRIRFIDTDWQRIERQRKAIQAAVNQVKDLSITELDHLANTALPMLQTNLTKKEITGLLLEVSAFLMKGTQMEQMAIPTKETCWNSVGVDGRKMIGVDFEANAKILREFFYETED